MTDVQALYHQTILPLPKSEKLRLAAIILQNLSDEAEQQLSALDFLEDLQVERNFDSAGEVDDYLKAERESWDI